MTSGKLPPGWMDIDFGAPLRGRVKALMSARTGGVGAAPYDTCNLGDHVQDAPQTVAANRALFSQHLSGSGSPVQPVWMTQVHGRGLIRLTHGAATGVNPCALSAQPVADGAFTTEPGLACTVMVADCLPVLLAAPEGRGVAALHAGWRGLAGAGDMAGRGIVQAGVEALCEATGADPADLLAWLGPCIGPAHFEVGPDVLRGFGMDAQAGVGVPRFTPIPDQKASSGWASSDDSSAKWLADLPGLAQDILRMAGVAQISGGGWCTVSEPSRFFSFRRDRVTGRQAASICLC